MPAEPAVYAGLALASSFIPAVMGFQAWQRRGRPGAVVLAVLLWVLALWGAIYAAEILAPGSQTTILLYQIEQAILLAVAPLWLVFSLQYTGRERWLTWPRLAFAAAVPMATLALILTNSRHELVWSFEELAFAGGLQPPAPEYGAWFWVDLTYRTLLVLVAGAFLILTVINSQRLYSRQSFFILLAFLAPLAGEAVYRLGLSPVSGFNPMSIALVITGTALAVAFFRYRLLDVSPVAHDAVLEEMNDGTIVLDLRNRIVDLNPSAERILGCRASRVIGNDFRQAVSGANVAPLQSGRGSDLLRRSEEYGRAHEEIKLGTEDGERYYDVSVSALHDARGRRTGHLMILHDITDNKLAAEQLDRKANYDPLTGLPNRALFYERLNQEIARGARRGGRPFALLFLDLDRFKMINDTLGHEVGDLLLKETAARITDAVREYDIVSRLAGDEFTVILPELSGTSDAGIIAGRIVRALAEPFQLAGNELRITSSVGVCFYPVDGKDPSTLVKNADTAMYRAKAAGKNRYEFFTEDELGSATKHLDFESELMRALENDELVLHYHPMMDINTSRLVGLETLVRWEYPEHGIIYPEEFVPVAEETGLIFAMERWVLREACRQTRSWQKRYSTAEELTVSVNLSSRHFLHPNLVGEVSRALEESQLPPGCLLLEVTESVLQQDPASSAVTLEALKRLGVKLAVDNFGSGYSSLSQLRRFPLHMLKIDRAFISDIERNDDNLELVSAIITLARALHLTVTAVGVETPQQLMLLKRLGCDAVQGYYFTESLTNRATSAFLVADLYY